MNIHILMTFVWKKNAVVTKIGGRVCKSEGVRGGSGAGGDHKVSRIEGFGREARRRRPERNENEMLREAVIWRNL